MKVKQFIKTVFIVFTVILLYSKNSLGQAVVSVPDLLAKFTLFDINNKANHMEKMTKTAEQIVKAAQMLETLKKQVARMDSIYDNQIVPLKESYFFVKGVYEKGKISDMWEIGEYVLGQSLNPVDYMPKAFKDPMIKDFMDDQLGWSYTDVRNLNDKTGYNHITSSEVRKIYKSLLPSSDYLLGVLEQGSEGVLEQGSENAERDKVEDYLNKLLQSDNDTVQFQFLLDKINRAWYKVDKEYKELLKLEDRVNKRLEKGNVSAEEYQALMLMIERKRDRLFLAIKELEEAMKELSDLQKSNAEAVLEDINNEIYLEELETLSIEAARINSSGNKDLVKFLFKKK